jgi:hypothetical protein
MRDLVNYRSNSWIHNKIDRNYENVNVTTTIVHICNGLYTRCLRVHLT